LAAFDISPGRRQRFVSARLGGKPGLGGIARSRL